MQVYVDDIIFKLTNVFKTQEFAKLMNGEFEISMMRELSFFLGLRLSKLYRNLDSSIEVSEGAA